MIEKNLTIGSTVALPKAGTGPAAGGPAPNGYQTVGPRLQDESIVYKEIEGLKDLPRGVLSEQAPASYRLIQTGQERYFDFIPGGAILEAVPLPAAPSPFHRTEKKGTLESIRSGKWQIEENDTPAPRYALIGVRACELAAIAIQDKVFLRPDFYDPIYRARREGLFILAVNCLHPNATCFCVSMGTGPRHQAGFRPVPDRTGRPLPGGSRLGTGSQPAAPPQLSNCPPPSCRTAANQAIEQAAGQMGRTPRHERPARPADRTPGRRTLERGRQTLPLLRQLHPGLPDLLLLGCHRPDGRDSAKHTRRERVWDSCFNPNLLLRLRREHPPEHPLALPPVADPQARHLERPVRRAGLRGLRALHHLVPGRDRPDRRSRRHPQGGEGMTTTLHRYRPHYAGYDR